MARTRLILTSWRSGRMRVFLQNEYATGKVVDAYLRDISHQKVEEKQINTCCPINASLLGILEDSVTGQLFRPGFSG